MKSKEFEINDTTDLLSRAKGVTDNNSGEPATKRRKTIKQCLFCRKRKLKCDKNKPMCSTCVSRNLPECVYVEQYSHEVDSRELLNSTPNVELLEKIQDLERQLKEAKSEKSILGSHRETLEINPLAEIFYIDEKADRCIYYGATSVRTLVHESRLRFEEYYKKAWHQLKAKRRKWKDTMGYSTLQELTAIESSQDGLHDESVLTAMCKALPTYEKVKATLDMFFAGYLFQCYQFVDPQKVMLDFSRCFIKGPTNLLTGQHPVVKLVPPNKKNYYCIGIITQILSILSPNLKVSQAFDTFNKFLLSYVTAKTFLVERVQFLMLGYLYRCVKGLGGGDNSHIIQLIKPAITTAVHIGFHNALDKIFKDTNCYRGEVVYAQNLWLWLVYADIEISFSMGVPLSLDDEFVNPMIFEDPNFGSVPLLKAIILPLRRCLKMIYCRNQIPDLEMMVTQVTEMVKTTFKPVTYYLDPKNLLEMPITEIDCFIFCLSLIINLSNLQRRCFSKYDPKTINTSIQYSIICMTICMKMMETYFAMETIRSDEDLERQSALPLQMGLAIFVWHKNLIRLIAEPFVLFGDLMSTTDVDYRFKYRLSPTFDLPLDSLETVDDHFVPMASAVQRLQGFFDRLESEKNSELIKGLKKTSYGFLITFSIEKIFRGLLKNAFDTRAFLKANKPIIPPLEVSESVVNSPNTLTSEMAFSDDDLKFMADEFWNNYDLSLSVLSQGDGVDLLSEFFMFDEPQEEA
ncbi:LAMI_0A01090g1_1 [Lachancea mirantina]|uniref:LAMI_0A01090g1_1 n=1 Tax=Lachancea mirantina TaxID=1230905 RepID=A0A1G4ILM9_9SACH|nr:LAMI_0A01090g1_1 [Lachancea mirantina]